MKKLQQENFIYDRTLKELLQGIPKRFITMLTGHEAVKLLDPTFPKTEERRADFVVELDNGDIFHLEGEPHLSQIRDCGRGFICHEYEIREAKLS